MATRKIENLSLNLLSEFGLLKCPINLDKLASKLNIRIEYQDLDDEVSGFLVKKESKNIIGVNEYHHPVRQRFTIAHEIGHYKLHVNQPLFIDYYKGSILYRSNNKPKNYIMEKEANQFAASLLMPKKLIEEQLSKLPEDMDYEDKLYELSQVFKVSKQAMDYRLKSLGYYDYGF